MGSLIQKSLRKEAKKIYNELYALYLKKTVVNAPFYEVVDQYISDKYKHFKLTLCSLVALEIPLELEISYDGQYIFCTAQENDKMREKYLKEKALKALTNKEALDQTGINMAKQLAAKDILNMDFIDILGEYLVVDDYNDTEYQYLLNNIEQHLLNIINED